MVLAVGASCPGLAQTNPGLQRLIQGAFGLPMGLILVVLTGAELFTGNTMLLPLAVSPFMRHGCMVAVFHMLVSDLMACAGVLTAVCKALVKTCCCMYRHAAVSRQMAPCRDHACIGAGKCI